MKYRSYVRALHMSPEVRALGSAYLYGTSYDLFTEYLSEKATAGVFMRRFGINFAGESEVDFYILLDFLTFVPFGDAGRAYLKEKEISLATRAHAYATHLLSCAGISLTEEENASLLRFFEAREGTARTVDAVGLAATVRKLGDRLFDGITLGKCAGSLGKGRELSRRLKAIAERVYNEELTAFDMEDALSDLPTISLDDNQAALVMDAAATLEI